MGGSVGGSVGGFVGGFVGGSSRGSSRGCSSGSSRSSSGGSPRSSIGSGARGTLNVDHGPVGLIGSSRGARVGRAVGLSVGASVRSQPHMLSACACASAPTARSESAKSDGKCGGCAGLARCAERHRHAARARIRSRHTLAGLDTRAGVRSNGAARVRDGPSCGTTGSSPCSSSGWPRDRRRAPRGAPCRNCRCRSSARREGGGAPLGHRWRRDRCRAGLGAPLHARVAAARPPARSHRPTVSLPQQPPLAVAAAAAPSCRARASSLTRSGHGLRPCACAGVRRQRHCRRPPRRLLGVVRQARSGAQCGEGWPRPARGADRAARDAARGGGASQRGIAASRHRLRGQPGEQGGGARQRAAAAAQTGPARGRAIRSRDFSAPLWLARNTNTLLCNCPNGPSEFLLFRRANLPRSPGCC